MSWGWKDLVDVWLAIGGWVWEVIQVIAFLFCLIGIPMLTIAAICFGVDVIRKRMRYRRVKDRDR
jgi:hypothetical protein